MPDGGSDPNREREETSSARPLATVTQMSTRGLRRFRACGVALGVAVLAAACSGGSGISEAEQRAKTESACALIERLADTAEPLASGDVSDPDAFRRDLDASVLEYVNTLDSLVEVVPATLRRDVRAVQQHVQRHEFELALTARAPVDDWATRACS